MVVACLATLLSTSLPARTLSRYALILQDPPSATARSIVRIGMGPEVTAAGIALREKQRPLQAELSKRRFHVTGSSQMLLNAIYVAADPSRIAELSRLPGVKRVVFLPPVHRSLDHAEQLVNLPAAWDFIGGMSNAGAGVKIAVIDSGIDQTHPAFQDSPFAKSVPSGYPMCEPQDCAFTNHKVIVARSYIRQQGAGDPNDPAADSRPDDFSPRDHQGHGTAVAMIIAGVTNMGPGDTITGFAPAAFLGSYKVFGTTGVNDGASEDVVIQALEDAVGDGMDIANLSLGGPALVGPLDSGEACGVAPGVPCDLLSQAVETATRMGMLVIAAGGNEGATGPLSPTLATVSSPGIAPSAISVAATTNSHLWRFGSSGWVSSEVTNFNLVTFFSSRGPAIGSAAIKPDMAAVGDNLFMAAQNYEPAGDLYNSTRCTVQAGTSFSAPMVAGAAALLKQRHPGWQPWQIKSALMNTATQDITDRGQRASVIAVGAGKLNVGNAVAANINVSPQSTSFGVIQSLPVSQNFQVRNGGATPVDLQIDIAPRTTDAHITISVSPSSLTIAPGQVAQFTVTLGGTPPDPGSYEGFIVIQGDAVTFRIPYLYLLGDGVPNNLIPLLGDGGLGLAGGPVPDGMLAFQVIDQFGLPVANVPATFSVVLGGGQITRADATTNAYGIATAEAIMGPSPSTNAFSGAAGGSRVRFDNFGVLQPQIADGGLVNAASFQSGPGIAPGSYISIFGANLSSGVGRVFTSRLPISLQNVSVSFDVPEAHLSVPGHVIYVSSRQVNVQVPWELRGQGSVRVKVSIGSASGAVMTVPVSDSSPGVFAADSGLAIAQDANFTAITSDHPATRGTTISIYGTGFGPVNRTPASGDPAPDASSTTQATPTASVGGVAAKVMFSGLAPGYAGLYQINVEIPADAQPGLQPLAIMAGGIAANTVLLPIQ